VAWKTSRTWRPLMLLALFGFSWFFIVRQAPEREPAHQHSGAYLHYQENFRIAPPIKSDEDGFCWFGEWQARMMLRCLKLDGAACTHASWDDDQLNYGAANPSLGPMVVGALRLATAATRDGVERVARMRTLMGGLAAACVATMAMLAWSLGLRWGALAAALGLLLHPVFGSVRCYLSPDIPMLLLTLLALLCLSHGSREEAEGPGALAALMGFGALAGLAVACKLYALTLVPVAAAALLATSPRSPRRWGALGAGLTLGALLFIAANPSLWSDPAQAWRAMTTGHLQAHAPLFSERAFDLRALPHLLSLPVRLPGVALDNHMTRALPAPWAVASVVGGALALVGLAASRRRAPVLVVGLVAAALLTGWPSLRIGLDWLQPRTLLLPATGAALLWGFGIAELARLVGLTARWCAPRRPDRPPR
jgi:hypothetical protein